MTATDFRFWASACIVLFGSAAAAAPDPKAPPPALTVQLMNLAGVKPAELNKAIAEATWIFAKAGVALNWVRCSPDGTGLTREEQCRDADDPLVFTVGVLATAPDFMPETGLGFALVFSGKRNHAGILYSRVAELSRAHPLIVQTEQVLAYAMVHELAHLLLESTAHSANGIMRAGCRPAELKALSQRRLLFGFAEVERLRRKLLERERKLQTNGETGIRGSIR
jgi:hypothetical protein